MADGEQITIVLKSRLLLLDRFEEMGEAMEVIGGNHKIPRAKR